MLRVMDELKNIHEREEFSLLYRKNRLLKTKDKIAFLKQNLGVLRSSDAVESAEEELLGLEDLVMSHIWEPLTDNFS